MSGHLSIVDFVRYFLVSFIYSAKSVGFYNFCNDILRVDVYACV